MLIKVTVFSKSKEEEIIKKANDKFEIKTKEKPERGMANERVKKILANYLNISEKNIKIIKGSREKHKILEIIEKY
ncbi:MAG: hypothetical protein BWY03_00109 [Parcubacteria group bacterium ADurb.Bin159]|jgi:uncharacterized protein YggU (UPF0235/DUF167 family)|nr:MAG: hypothetical protein BWY03_00109 [Parcubacteria group bacterium ADurb.Bin159]